MSGRADQGCAYELGVAKEDFKFAVAHFTVFGPGAAELLHGHNYSVRVKVSGSETDELGLLLDLRDLKSEIRRICRSLDEKTLIPTACPLVTVGRGEGQVKVRFGELEYGLAEQSVVLLELRNTSIEELALYVWRELAPILAGRRGRRLEVEVAETPGQSCNYAADLPTAAGEGR